MTEVQKELFALRDEGNRDFVAKLIPTVDRARILGIRTPALRAFAKDFAKRPGGGGLPEARCPIDYLEENGLHAFLIERIRDYDACIEALDAFLPHVDNWATCDSLSPPASKSIAPV